VAHTVLASPVSPEGVTLSPVQETEAGVLLENGRSVRLHVEAEFRQGRDPAITQLQHSVELSVLAAPVSPESVTLFSPVQFTEAGVLSENGLNVQVTVLVEDLNIG